MAQAADSPIGFHSPAKDPDPTISPLSESALAELHAWQASPAGMAEAHVAGLAATIADLRRLAASPFGLPLLAGELPDLKRAATELNQILSRINLARETPR